MFITLYDERRFKFKEVVNSIKVVSGNVVINISAKIYGGKKTREVVLENKEAFIHFSLKDETGFTLLRTKKVSHVIYDDREDYIFLLIMVEDLFGA